MPRLRACFPLPDENVSCMDGGIVLRTSAKSILYLVDYNYYQTLPSFRSTGIEVFSSPENGVHCLIHVHNLKELSYLNLVERWYTREVDSLGRTSLVQPGLRNLKIVVEAFLALNVQIEMIMYLRSLLYEKPNCANTIKALLWYVRVSGRSRIPFPADYFADLLEIVYIHHRNSDLVLDLLITFCARVQVTTFLGRNLLYPYLIRFILEKANRARFNVRQMDRLSNFSRNVPRFQPCPLVECLFEGDLPILEIFLAYGFEREENNIDSRNAWYIQKMLEICHMRIPAPSTSVYNYDVRRHFLLIETLCIVWKFLSCETRESSIEWIDSGNLYFGAIPDPFISSVEIRTKLEENGVTDYTLAKTLSTCEEHFFEIISEIYEPRPLMHLCRCAIRSSLRRNFQLPNGILNLNLPHRLESYLLLNTRR